MKYTKIESLRFLFAGGINTIFSYFIYLLALLAVNPQKAYTVSFAISVLISYFLHLKITFRATHNWRKLAAYPFIYLVQYAIGLLILKIALAVGIPKELAPIFILAVNVPLAFLIGKLILRRL